ncbi:MAG: DUF4833 domain-containing protein [Deltaproteobacteria bacterium]|nr:DUF4833 domain-containing protein [Deltaproteobacteria bacterium]
MKQFAYLCLILVGGLVSFVSPALGKGDFPLFFIERSKNRNIVQYSMRPSGEVVAYWVLENGEERGLTAVQRKFAYGIKSQRKLGKDRFEIILTAFKKRNILVKKTRDGYRAFVTIDGQEAVLDKIHVESRERWFGMPKVLFIDLFGRSSRKNFPIGERIYPH